MRIHRFTAGRAFDLTAGGHRVKPLRGWCIQTAKCPLPHYTDFDVGPPVRRGRVSGTEQYRLQTLERLANLGLLLPRHYGNV